MPNGFEIRRSYDANDRLMQMRVLDKKNGIDCRIIYTYDAAGNVLSQTIQGANDEKLQTGYRYDWKNRLTHKTSLGKGTTKYLYDTNDRLIKEIRPNGYDVSTDDGAGIVYSYDCRGNRVREVNALGQLVQEQNYSLQNLPTIQTDGLGNQTTMDYTLDDQMKDIQRGRNREQKNLQSYAYNAQGQIIGITDGNGERIAYDADTWGRITGIGFSDGVREGYEYTPSGQVSKAIDGNGNLVQYRYNRLGKLRERIDQAGYNETYQYDAEGNLILHVDRDDRQVYRTYNVFGAPVYEKVTDANGDNPNITTYRYDSIGRLVKAVCDGHSYEYIYYAYNAQGQIVGITDGNGEKITYDVDSWGRITGIGFSDGVREGYE